MSRYQFQAKADGIGPLSGITADKWYPCISQPVRCAASIVLTIAACCAPIAPPPAVTTDQWQGETSLDVPQRFQPRQLGLTTIDALLPPVTAGEKQPKVCSEIPPKLAQPRMAGIAVLDPLLVPVPVRVEAWQPRPQPDLPMVAQPRQAGIVVVDTLYRPLSVAEKQPLVCEILSPPTFQPRQAGITIVDVKVIAQSSAEKQPLGFVGLPPKAQLPRQSGWYTSTVSLPAEIQEPTIDQWMPAVGFAPRFNQNATAPRQLGQQVIDPLFVPNTPRVSQWMPEQIDVPRMRGPTLDAARRAGGIVQVVLVSSTAYTYLLPLTGSDI